MASLEKLFEDTLRDMYYAEKKIAKTLPKMAKKARSGELRMAFERHLDETETQIERLERIFELLDKPARAKKCPAIDGIIEEGGDLMEEHETGEVLDAGLAAAAQAVEHYEIARYGTLATWANELGQSKVSKLLVETLNEEEATDELLTELAKLRLNKAAAELGAIEDDEASRAKPPGRPKTRAA